MMIVLANGSLLLSVAEVAVKCFKTDLLHRNVRMRIKIKRDFYAGMTKNTTHDFWIYTLVEHECGVAVAQVVKANLRQTV